MFSVLKILNNFLIDVVHTLKCPIFFILTLQSSGEGRTDHPSGDAKLCGLSRLPFRTHRGGDARLRWGPH
jgi:hypothetical protein